MPTQPVTGALQNLFVGEVGGLAVGSCDGDDEFLVRQVQPGGTPAPLEDGELTEEGLPKRP